MIQKFFKIFPLLFISGVAIFFAKSGLSISGNLNPAHLTRANISVYRKIQLRVADLNSKEKIIGQKEIQLTAQEERVENRIQKLKQLSLFLQKQINTLNAQYSTALNALIKSLESMKPEEAGKILRNANLNTLVFVCTRLNPSKLGKIMPFMDPTQAQAVIQFSVMQIQAASKISDPNKE
jgi:flagellar motility protein MotE (MotC chaperone)